MFYLAERTAKGVVEGQSVVGSHPDVAAAVAEKLPDIVAWQTRLVVFGVHKGAHHPYSWRTVAFVDDVEKSHAFVRMAHVEVPLAVIEHTTATHSLI